MSTSPFPVPPAGYSAAPPRHHPYQRPQQAPTHQRRSSPPSARAPPSPARSREDESPEQQSGKDLDHGDNYWDDVPPPPASLKSILDSFRRSGEGDRDLLLSILGAKKAEEERLTAIIQTRLTVLQARLNIAAMQAAQPMMPPTPPTEGGPSPIIPPTVAVTAPPPPPHVKRTLSHESSSSRSPPPRHHPAPPQQQQQPNYPRWVYDSGRERDPRDIRDEREHREQRDMRDHHADREREGPRERELHREHHRDMEHVRLPPPVGYGRESAKRSNSDASEGRAPGLDMLLEGVRAAERSERS